MTVPLCARKRRSLTQLFSATRPKGRLHLGKSRGSTGDFQRGLLPGAMFFSFPSVVETGGASPPAGPLRILNGGTQRPRGFFIFSGVQLKLPPPGPFFRGSKRKKYVFLYFIKLRKMALNSFCSPAIIIYFQTLLQGTAPFSYPTLLFLINEPSLQ